MSDVPPSPDRRIESAESPGKAADGSGDREPAPLDWRLAAIIGIAVLFLVAVYVNRKYYGKKVPDSVAGGQTTSRRPDPSAGESPPPLSPVEHYALLTHQRQLQAAGTVFRVGDSTFVIARPPTPVASEKDPQEIGRIIPGMMFDISRRLEGVSPLMLHRRLLPGGRGVMFMDTFPQIGATDRIKMVFKPAAEVALTDISDADRVIGILIGDQARAYPIKLANYHEVINDTVGGKPIVIAWSALADAACAMERTLPEGGVVSFGSAGIIYQRAILLYETKTRSLWSPVRRVAITGEHTGAVLKPVQTSLTTWQAWKRIHPATTAFVRTDPLLKLNYGANPALPPVDPNRPSSHYLDRRNTIVLYPVYGFELTHSPMNLKTPVFGVTGPDGESVKAYTAEHLRATSGAFQDAIGGKEVTLRYDPEANLLTAKDSGGEPLLTEAMLWLCWEAAHPKTEVWQRETMTPPFAEPAKPSVPDLAEPSS